MATGPDVGRGVGRDVSGRDVDRLNALTKTLMALAIIGAINWGLIGFFNWNLVDAIFGGGARETTSGASRVIYAIVGLAGLALAFLAPSLRPVERRLDRAATGRVDRIEPTPTGV